MQKRQVIVAVFLSECLSPKLLAKTKIGERADYALAYSGYKELQPKSWMTIEFIGDKEAHKFISAFSDWIYKRGKELGLTLPEKCVRRENKVYVRKGTRNAE